MALEHHSLMLLRSLLQTWQVFVPLLLKKGKIHMELLFYSSIVSISDWKYGHDQKCWT